MRRSAKAKLLETIHQNLLPSLVCDNSEAKPVSVGVDGVPACSSEALAIFPVPSHLTLDARWE